MTSVTMKVLGPVDAYLPTLEGFPNVPLNRSRPTPARGLAPRPRSLPRLEDYLGRPRAVPAAGMSGEWAGVLRRRPTSHVWACPARLECLEHAMANHAVGLWGGLDDAGRMQRWREREA